MPFIIDPTGGGSGTTTIGSTTTTTTTTSSTTTSSTTTTPSTTTSSTTTTTSSTTLSTLTTPSTVSQVTVIVTESDGQSSTEILSTSTVLSSGTVVTSTPTVSNNKSDAHVGAIVGGVVGGVLGLGIIAFLIVCWLRRQSEDDFDGNFDPDRISGHNSGLGGGGTLPQVPVDLSADDNVAPTPYRYSHDGNGVQQMSQYAGSGYSSDVGLMAGAAAAGVGAGAAAAYATGRPRGGAGSPPLSPSAYTYGQQYNGTGGGGGGGSGGGGDHVSNYSGDYSSNSGVSYPHPVHHHQGIGAGYVPVGAIYAPPGPGTNTNTTNTAPSQYSGDDDYAATSSSPRSSVAGYSTVSGGGVGVVNPRSAKEREAMARYGPRAVGGLGLATQTEETASIVSSGPPPPGQSSPPQPGSYSGGGGGVVQQEQQPPVEQEPEVFVHTDGGRVEIPPGYDSIQH